MVLLSSDKMLWLVGQVVKTPPSHGGNRGSIPLQATIIFKEVAKTNGFSHFQFYLEHTLKYFYFDVLLRAYTLY